MKIIAIHDGNSGHKSQLDGVLQGFLEDNIKIVQAKKSWINWLPAFLAEKFLFILSEELKDYEEPQLVISIGRKSLLLAIYLKKKYPKTKLVFLMPSGVLSEKYGDLIFYHSYKKRNYSSAKYIPIISAPHGLSKEKLEKSLDNWKEVFFNYKKPIITVVVGGNAKKIKLTKLAIKDLLKEIYKIQQITEGSVFITTSRRTGVENESYLKEELEDLIDQGKCFFWGYHTQNRFDKNPYLAMLAIANYVIVSGESISMISEACSLKENIGVYIFFSKNFKANRYMKFHENLYLNNYAKNLTDFSTKTTRKSLNITSFVIEKIKQIL